MANLSAVLITVDEALVLERPGKPPCTLQPGNYVAFANKTDDAGAERREYALYQLTDDPKSLEYKLPRIANVALKIDTDTYAVDIR